MNAKASVMTVLNVPRSLSNSEKPEYRIQSGVYIVKCPHAKPDTNHPHPQFFSDSSRLGLASLGFVHPCGNTGIFR